MPEGKDPSAVDQKLTEKYGICISRQARARRKAASSANLHYIRYDRFFVLLATHGKNSFFVKEAANLRDIRKVVIKCAGHSISYKQGSFLRKEGTEPAAFDHDWHSRVQNEREKYAELKAYFIDVAVKRSAETSGRDHFNLPFEPYALVRQQLLHLLRLINKARHLAGFYRLSPEVLRYQRTIVKPFDDSRIESSSLMLGPVMHRSETYRGDQQRRNAIRECSQKPHSVIQSQLP